MSGRGGGNSLQRVEMSALWRAGAPVWKRPLSRDLQPAIQKAPGPQSSNVRLRKVLKCGPGRIVYICILYQL